MLTQLGTGCENPRAPLLQASYHGVPLVGMPLLAEQPDNIARAVDCGYALSVSVKNHDSLAADLHHALAKILAEPGFAISAARVSKLMQAQRGTPAERAAGMACVYCFTDMPSYN